MARLTSLLLLGLLACPAAVLAGRPFITEDAGTVASGKFELEIGHAYLDGAGHPSSFLGDYTLNVGLPGRAEIDLTVPVAYHLDGDGPSTSGFGDLELLLKARFIDEDAGWRPALALAGTARFPTGDPDRGLGAGKASYAIRWVASKEIGDLHIDADAGWRFAAVGEDGLLSGVALAYELVEGWSLAAEYAGFTDFAGGTPNEEAGLLLGLIWSPAEGIAIDGGVRADAADAPYDFNLILGLTWAF